MGAGMKSFQRRNPGDHVDNKNSLIAALPASKVLIWELGLSITVPLTLSLTDRYFYSTEYQPAFGFGGREVPLGG
jgi:hypothetical protein